MADDKTDATKRREADYAATSALKEAHAEEFNALKVKEMAARGITWSPKPTEEQKALATVQELVAKYPSARAALTGESAPAPVGQSDPA